MGDWNYTNLWRTNYEAREVGAWGASMLASTGVQVLTGMPMMPYLITMGVQAGFALSALPRAVRVYRAKKSLLGSPLSFTSIGDIAKIVEKHPDSFYYGQAFQWRQQHGQHAFELQSRDMSAVLGKKGLRDPRALGIDAMAAQLRQMQIEQQRLLRTLGAAEKDRKLVETQEKVTSLEEQIKLLHQEIGRVGRNAQKDSESSSNDAGAVKEAATTLIPERNPHFVQKATNSADALGDVYSNLPPPPPVDPRARSSEKVEAPKIRVIRNEKAKDEDQEDKELSVTIPAGSILSGVLVTGMDAPTGKQAQRDPFPSGSLRSSVISR